jgi:hypothetical protein
MDLFILFTIDYKVQENRHARYGKIDIPWFYMKAHFEVI